MNHMNLIPMLAQVEVSSTPWLKIVLGCGSVLFVVFVIAIIWASRYTKAGPNQVLVISGNRHKITDPDGNVKEIGFRMSRAAAFSSGPCLKKWTCCRWNC